MSEDIKDIQARADRYRAEIQTAIIIGQTAREHQHRGGTSHYRRVRLTPLPERSKAWRMRIQTSHRLRTLHRADEHTLALMRHAEDQLDDVYAFYDAFNEDFSDCAAFAKKIAAESTHEGYRKNLADPRSFNLAAMMGLDS